MSSSDQKSVPKQQIGKTKGKSMHTSTPEIAFKFNVENEALQELTVYPEKNIKIASKRESSKCSDGNEVNNASGSRCPTSETPAGEMVNEMWTNLLSEIKGKFTKSSEEKTDDTCHERKTRTVECKALRSINSKLNRSCDIDSYLSSTSIADTSTPPVPAVISTDVQAKEHQSEKSLDVNKNVTVADKVKDVTHVGPKDVESGIECIEGLDLVQPAAACNQDDQAPKYIGSSRHPPHCSHCFHDNDETSSLDIVYKWRGTIYIIILSVLWSIVPFALFTFIIGIIFAFQIQKYSTFIRDILNMNFDSDHESSWRTFNNTQHQSSAPMTSVDTNEGWLNELRMEYDPELYHFGLTQTVKILLNDGKLSILTPDDKFKISKRAYWDEKKYSGSFKSEIKFDITEGSVLLLPDGLPNKRKWSKKYPICLRLSKNSYIRTVYHNHGNDSTTLRKDRKNVNTEDEASDYLVVNYRELDPASEIDCENNSKKERAEIMQDDNETEYYKRLFKEDLINLYLFARTDRDKEFWFNKFLIATNNKKFENENCFCAATNAVNYHDSIFNLFKDYRGSTTVSREEFVTNIFTYLNVDDIVVGCDAGAYWINALCGRLVFDYFQNAEFLEMLRTKFQRKLSTIRMPRFMESLKLSSLQVIPSSPIVRRVLEPWIDEKGIWLEFDIGWEGAAKIEIETKLDLMKIKKDKLSSPQSSTDNSLKSHESCSPSDVSFNGTDASDISGEMGRCRRKLSAIFDSEAEDSPEASADEDELELFFSQYRELGHETETCSSSSPTSSTSSGASQTVHKRRPFTFNKTLLAIDRLASSKIFDTVTDNTLVQRFLNGISNQDLALFVEVKKIYGNLVVNIPPLNSDRIWYGFRENYKLELKAFPKIGSLSFVVISRYIEKVLRKDFFEKIFVLPNMDDFIMPSMGKCDTFIPSDSSFTFQRKFNSV